MWESYIRPYKEMLLRPPRANYHETDLGPREFKYGNKYYKRKDFEVKIKK